MKTKTILALILSICLVLFSGAGVLAADNGEGDPIDPPVTPSTPGVLSIDQSITLSNGQTYGKGYQPASYKNANNVHVVDLQLPLTTSESVRNLRVSFDSASAASVPFDMVNAIKTKNSLKPGESHTFGFFALTIKNDVYNGNYPVTFEVTYNQGGEQKTQYFTVYMVVTGKPQPTEGGGGEDPSASQPKLILTSYSTNPQQVQSGNVFDLTLEIKNPTGQAVQNVLVHVSNEEGFVIPAEGTASFYLDSIDAGQAITQTLKLQMRPDATAKTHVVKVKMDYDAGGTPVTMEEMASINVKQITRLVLDPPNVPQSVMDGGSFYVPINLYNMGKSTLYNVMVKLEGDGLTPESSFFAGTMEPGATKVGEIYVNAMMTGGSMELPEGDGSTPGENPENGGDIKPLSYTNTKAVAVPVPDGGVIIDGGEADPGMDIIAPAQTVNGRITVTYENELGEEDTMEHEFSIMIEPMGGGMDPGWEIPPEEIAPSGGFPWLWVIIGVVVVVIILVIILLRRSRAKKRRALEAEDLDFLDEEAQRQSQNTMPQGDNT